MLSIVNGLICCGEGVLSMGLSYYRTVVLANLKAFFFFISNRDRKAPQVYMEYTLENT